MHRQRAPQTALRTEITRNSRTIACLPGFSRSIAANRSPGIRLPLRNPLYTVLNGVASMDHLWSPWRFTYITSAEKTLRPGVPAGLAAWPGDLGCVFCNLVASIDYAIAHGMSADQADRAGGLILRGQHCFICLNAFPYTSGHVMAMPYAHLDRLAALPAAAADELMRLAQRTEAALEQVYAPHGFNFGMNVGQAAGAGVAWHLHLHAMPRWSGDTNFMTTVAETRVLPEDLDVTWKRLREAFAAQKS